MENIGLIIASQCSFLANFCQQSHGWLEQGQIIFSNMINTASEKSTNL